MNTAAASPSQPVQHDRYKWVALTNTTLGILMATINSSIVLIALPNIFKGIKLNPLDPGNSGYFLWLLMGFMVVTAVLVVSFGHVGDMFGRVKMYTVGFAIFTLASILLSVTWSTGAAGAIELIVFRIIQGVGGAFIFANSAAILTDAFPKNQRGLALGINNVAGIAGSFIGLVLGGLLAPLDWRLVFLVSVPFGVAGTLWAIFRLKEQGFRTPAKIDWIGNITFAVGLIAILVGITNGIEPYGTSTMGWGSPAVLAELIGGAIVLAFFGWYETKTDHPMFKLRLFRIRAFSAGNFAALLASMGRGGMMFILIIWLQGIWLPLHGYTYAQTPLWAGIYLLPLTAGFLVAGPVSGLLSDHFGARPFATGGMILAAVSFYVLELLPTNFGYPGFAGVIFLNGVAMGLFASPNRAGIMNSLPPRERGAGAGMAATFQNSAMVLSIGVFFSLMIVGLSAALPPALFHGLTTHGVPGAVAQKIAGLPPVALLFAAFLGINPLGSVLGPQVLGHLSQANAAFLTSKGYFPQLISTPFHAGLAEALNFAMIACLLAAFASVLRGKQYHHPDEEVLPSAGASTSPGAVHEDATPSQPVLVSKGTTAE